MKTKEKSKKRLRCGVCGFEDEFCTSGDVMDEAETVGWDYRAGLKKLFTGQNEVVCPYCVSGKVAHAVAR